MKLKPDGNGLIGKEAAILIAGFIPVSGVTFVNPIFGAVGVPAWVIIWAVLIAGGE